MKKFLFVLLAAMMILSCTVSASASTKEDKSKTETEVVKMEKDTAEKGNNYSAEIAAAEDAALNAMGISRSDTKFVSAYVEYQKGQAYAVHVKVGVYTRGVGTSVTSFLIDMDSMEILRTATYAA